MMQAAPFRIAVVGSGPAGLMAAHELAAAGAQVTLFEREKSAGRKLLVAGASGLNITFDASLEELASHYRNDGGGRMGAILRAYPPTQWLNFLKELGLETFLGTSRRYFVREPDRETQPTKASGLLKAWLARLSAVGVKLSYERELTGLCAQPAGVALEFEKAGSTESFDAAILAVGGASWLKEGNEPSWAGFLRKLGLRLEPFEASNVGYEVSWPEPLLKAAEAQPLKNIVLTTAKGSRRGDLVITRYGLEGTPIYTLGTAGEAWLDLKPDLSEAELIARMRAVKENLSPFRRAKKKLGLDETALTLLRQCSAEQELASVEQIAARLKRFPLLLTSARPLTEAISSRGGLAWEELEDDLMIRRLPRVFAAGEMIAWDAPTGGFLIQGCVSQGHYAARAVLRRLARGCSTTPRAAR